MVGAPMMHKHNKVTCMIINIMQQNKEKQKKKKNRK